MVKTQVPSHFIKSQKECRSGNKLYKWKKRRGKGTKLENSWHEGWGFTGCSSVSRKICRVDSVSLSTRSDPCRMSDEAILSFLMFLLASVGYRVWTVRSFRLLLVWCYMPPNHPKPIHGSSKAFCTQNWKTMMHKNWDHAHYLSNV